MIHNGVNISVIHSLRFFKLVISYNMPIELILPMDNYINYTKH